MVDDFEKFISDFGEPVFDETEDSFNIDMDWVDKTPLKVLFAHFPPSMSGIGGDCFPLFFSKLFPNATVHITYDKGRIVTPSEFIDMFRSFEVKDGQISEMGTHLDSEYDIIIGRSSSFNCMHERDSHRKLIENSGFPVNIKPIHLSNREHSERYCDLVFPDDFGVGSTPSPLFRNSAISFLNNTEKQKLVLFCGQIHPCKNQLDYIRNLDSGLCEDYSFVFLGQPSGSPEYLNAIKKECIEKGIGHYIITGVEHELIPYFMALSQIQVVNSDPEQSIQFDRFDRPIRQRYDPLPRVLGEAAASDVHSVCSIATLYSPDLAQFVTQYNHKSYKDLNDTFENALKIDARGYHKKMITLEERCKEIIDIIMGEYNGKL